MQAVFISHFTALTAAYCGRINEAIRAAHGAKKGHSMNKTLVYLIFFAVYSAILLLIGKGSLR
ncbi:MAG: hypothetical protein RSF90_00480, partial [Pygmaiobacter sp.]